MMQEKAIIEKPIKNQYKFIALISMIFVLSMVGSSLLVNRIVTINIFLVPGGILLYPLSYSLGDILSEVYGYKLARHILWCGIICQLMFSLTMDVMLKIPAASFWHNQSAYETVFNPVIVYCVSCLIGTILGGFANIYAISKWKILFRGRFFGARSITSTALGEAIFSIVALTPVFIFEQNFSTTLRIVISAYIFKIIYALLIAPIAVIIVKKLKEVEGVDVYDYDTNFNPFQFGV